MRTRRPRAAHTGHSTSGSTAHAGGDASDDPSPLFGPAAARLRSSSMRDHPTTSAVARSRLDVWFCAVVQPWLPSYDDVAAQALFLAHDTLRARASEGLEVTGVSATFCSRCAAGYSPGRS